MIDCHAHAYPELVELAQRLPTPVADAVGMVLPAATAVASRLRGAVSRRLPGAQGRMSTEKVAAMRKKGPRLLHRAAEMVGGLALTPQVLATGSLERLFASMDRHGIARTVVIATPPYGKNDWLLEAGDERIIPVATLPDLPAAAALSTWRDAFEALADAGARGFKIHPNMDDLDPGHSAYRALFEVARARKRFVILHTGCFNAVVFKHQREADPSAFEPLFDEYRDVAVCLAHMNRDRPDRVWSLMKSHPQLYTDTSWQPADNIRRAIAEVGPERILLGSDWPLLHDDLQGDALRALRRAASDSDVDRIARENGDRFIGSK